MSLVLVCYANLSRKGSKSDAAFHRSLPLIQGLIYDKHPDVVFLTLEIGCLPKGLNMMSTQIALFTQSDWIAGKYHRKISTFTANNVSSADMVTESIRWFNLTRERWVESLDKKRMPDAKRILSTPVGIST